MARAAISRMNDLLVALACACAGCTDRGGPVVSDGQSTEGQASDAVTDSNDTTGAPDQAILEAACENYCPLEIQCFPEAIPEFYASVEECVAGCILSLENGYRDGCGPERFRRITCWADLSCEQLIDLFETGLSSTCGDINDPICGAE